MRMAAIIIVTGVLVLSAGLALANQATQPDTAAPQKLMLKSHFFKGQMVSFDGQSYTQAYRSDRLEQTLATVPGAADDLRSARKMHGASMALGGIGGASLGFAVGWGLTRDAGWDTPQTIMAVAGGAIGIVGAMLDNSANNRLRRAVDTYNNTPRPIAIHVTPAWSGSRQVGGGYLTVSVGF